MKHIKIRGFTLPEMLITLGVVAIILSTAVPSLSSTIKDNRLATQLNRVVADIHFARSEAAKRDVRVIMCRSANPNAATPTCSGSTKVWTTGYIIYADNGNYANSWYDNGSDILLRRSQPVTSGLNLRTNSVWNNYLEFNPNGSTHEGGEAVMAICDDRGSDHGRRINVALTGIPKMYSGNIGDCSPDS
jgi:type IV fimbrial biogenesis protein FimT